ncbi:MAG: Holliday junction resolvase-like protein [Candidatus Diapherotrites archaeon]|nr:Holliday junction resolvase-like protein [Candidatus Diapherotrites archaeon]
MAFEIILAILAAIILILGFVVVFLFKQNSLLKEKLQEILFDKRSQSVKYGKLTEQWIPFSEKFPFNPENFRFIGTPIDGLAFEDEKVFFVEFKTASAQLNEKQKQIKQIVKNKNVEWIEFKINEEKN